MRRYRFPLLILAMLAGAQGCRTTKETSSALRNSASRDVRFLEPALKNYAFEVENLATFTDRVDWQDFFEDVETKQRTYFVTFTGEDDGKCTVGLSADEVAAFKVIPHQGLKANAMAPVRTNDRFHSQIFFAFENPTTKAKEEFLASCTRSKRRFTVSDLASILAGFIRFRAVTDDAPAYDVCCRCEADIFVLKQANESLAMKGASIYLTLNRVTDGVCQSKLSGKKYFLRPGDPYFALGEDRYQIWRTCDEVAPELCTGGQPAAVKPSQPAEPSSDSDRQGSVPPRGSPMPIPMSHR